MAFTLQPATKDDFIDREGILNEMLSTLSDEWTRMGFALVGPRKAGVYEFFDPVFKIWVKSKYVPTNL